MPPMLDDLPTVRRAYVAEPPTRGEQAAASVCDLWREREDGADDRAELVASRCR